VDLTSVRISVSPPGGTYYSTSNGTTIGNSFSATAPAEVHADGTFAIASIAPGIYKLRCVLPAGAAQSWSLTDAVLADRDLLEGPFELGPGVALTGAQLTLSNQHTEISGALVRESGSVSGYAVVAFPFNRALWHAGSRRMASTQPAGDGRFTFRDLPAGDYLLASIPEADSDEWQTLLDRLAPGGVKVSIKSGDKTTQDLKIER
jgi:hypothetical protein